MLWNAHDFTDSGQTLSAETHPRKVRGCEQRVRVTFGFSLPPNSNSIIESYLNTVDTRSYNVYPGRSDRVDLEMRPHCERYFTVDDTPML